MNILILSAGTRNKVVQYFVKTLNGKGTVVATDMSNLAPAIYEADKYYIVPRMTDPGYLDELNENRKLTREYAKKRHEINAVQQSIRKDFEKLM